MNFFRKLYSFNDDINFRRGWRIAYAISAIFLLAGLFALLTGGLKLGIDFKGGTSWQFPANGTSVSTVRDVLKPLGGTDATIQTLTTDKGTDIRVEVGTKVDAAKAEVALSKVSHNSVDVVQSNRSQVGPSWGHDVSNKAIHALIYFFIVIAAYIWWRLEWQMAVGAIIAVIHDVLISVGVYAIFKIEVTPATVVAFLTILGYSLYDTIVVYDKMRDNQSKVTPNGNYTYTDMVNLSLNQTIVRSLNTTISALLPVMSILVIGAWIMGAVTLEEFGLALLVGLFVGAYSSIFIAAPIVVALKEREPRNKAIRERLEAKRAGLAAPLAAAAAATGDGEPVEGPAGAAQPVSAGARTATTTATRADTPYSANHPPRPRKKGKKR
ncbi:MAG TPA: protein translocase subunit SecF [Acidimicrobiales bacterium]